MQAGVGGGKNKANMCVSNVERTNERVKDFFLRLQRRKLIWVGLGSTCV